MDARDTKRYLDWGVNLLGKILLVGWVVGIAAWLAATASGEPWVFALVLAFWPGIVGAWLWAVSAPVPLWADYEEDGTESES